MGQNLINLILLIRVQLRKAAEYRLSFAVSLISAILLVTLEFGSFALVLKKFERMAGWSVSEVCFLYALGEIAFGLAYFIFGGFDHRSFSTLIRSGQFDVLLLKPVNVTVQILASGLSLSKLGRVAVGVAILLTVLPNLHLATESLLFMPVALVGMILFFAGIFIISSATTFWTVDSVESLNILTFGVNQLMAYPMTSYQDGLRIFFTYIIPAAFLNYYPALMMLGKADPFGLPPAVGYLSPVIGGGVFLGSLVVWQFGLSRYQSTGC